MKMEVFQGNGKEHNQWRWRIVARNGQIVAVSGEAFYSEKNANQALQKFVTNLVTQVLKEAEKESKKNPGGA
jgi:uncharacterized protein YegP (UPF0339 family)